MTVKKDAVVEMHYTLKNDSGDVIDSSQGKEPMPFIQGHGNIIPGLESALEGMKVGETCDVSVNPEEGYGVHHPEAIQEIPKEALQGIDSLEIACSYSLKTNKVTRLLCMLSLSTKTRLLSMLTIHWQVKHCTSM